MNVVVRTHGGLGNQLFQLLYARLYARAHGASLREVHDLRYAHAFARSHELTPAPPPSLPANAISALRIPKVVTRLGCRRDVVTVFGTAYIDGYFQRLADYSAFDRLLLRAELLRIREELRVAPAPAGGYGVHLRLGDFFRSEQAVAEHLSGRLKTLPHGAGIVTNEEARLEHPVVAGILADADATVIPTGHMTAEQVLRTLAGFAVVDGNDSTLLFWASVLSGMACDYRNAELRVLRDFFLKVLTGNGDR
ncbi:hypothetical protein [Sphingomonas sp. BE138]|uniref:hypothetical protein n=1 Tax=Sphingomonas sp. BE138 TaxID=2817845 RepID=UPI00286B3389|nr:hypothetical protein [Sphingomonas sp. BE138]